MELKHMDKGIHSSAISAGSTDAGLMSSTLTLSRGPPAEYEPARPRPASLDRRHYVPTYVGSGASCSSDEACVSRASPASVASCRRCDYRPMTGVGVGVGVGCAATCERRPHPRHAPDQSTPLLSSVGPLGSPQASLASLHHHHPPPPPCGSGSCPLGPACGALGGGTGPPVGVGPGGDIYACAARERGQYVAYEPLGHYTHRDSLSSDATVAGAGSGVGAGVPPVGGGGAGSLRRGFLDNGSDHSTPAHSRAGSGRDTSPYKKSASSSPGHIPNRLQLGGSVAHCPTELEPLTPSRSTERLHREMQNLEGLMKDLSAITQQQFHC
ncbi:hypothetical protein evm_013593 [Chilo suppressalis]|nr:hypothetical protein evm_013593 [Chilo suppressalis]